MAKRLSSLILFLNLLLNACASDPQSQEGLAEQGEFANNALNNEFGNNQSSENEFGNNEFGDNEFGDNESGDNINSDTQNEFGDNGFGNDNFGGNDNLGGNDNFGGNDDFGAFDNGGFENNDNFLSNDNNEQFQNNIGGFENNQGAGENEQFLQEGNNQQFFANQNQTFVDEGEAINNAIENDAFAATDQALDQAVVDTSINQVVDQAAAAPPASGGRVQYVTSAGAVLYDQPNGSNAGSLSKGDHPLVFAEGEFVRTSDGYYIPSQSLTDSPISRTRRRLDWSY